MTLPYRALLALVVLAAVFALGLFVGWRAADDGMQRAAAHANATAADAIAVKVQEQNTKVQQELQAQEAQTASLMVTQQALRTNSAAIGVEIQHATFPAAPRLGGCPYPVGSDDFLRLYNRAARAGDPARAGSAGGAR